MHKRAKDAFTLIEVMVAVVIISTVIMALLELTANNRHIFSVIEKKNGINQYLSFTLANSDYGFENKKTTLYSLVSDFDLESDLRRELKSKKCEIIYQELESIDLSDFDEKDKTNREDEELKESNSGLVFEVGKTVLRLEDSSNSILRIRLQ